jgi:hypothetical protein
VVFTLVVLVGAAHLAMAQNPSATPKHNAKANASNANADLALVEATPLQPRPASPGPIHDSWHMRKMNGTANLVVNPDGTYIFSGMVNDKKPNHDFDITLALKSSLGSVIFFRYAADASNGVEWSKQGQSEILKDNFTTFAGKHQAAWAYTLPLSAAGKVKLYEEREKKREELRKEIEEAVKKQENKIAEQKKKELERHQQQEIAQARQQQSSGGGGGSSLGSVLGTIGSVAGTILACL